MYYSKPYDKKLAAIYADQALRRAAEDRGRIYLRRQVSSYLSSSEGGQKQGARLIDMGCGSGIDLGSYSDMGLENLFGLDASWPALCEAKRFLKGKARLVCGRLEHLPFQKESFDLVVSRFSLIYCKNLEKVFDEASRILKPGGLFAAVVSHPTRDAHLPLNEDGETLTVRFYHGAVTTTYPTHCLEDYIGPSFQKGFSLDSVEAFSDRAEAGYLDEAILNAPLEEPTVLCFSGRKRPSDEAI